MSEKLATRLRSALNVLACIAILIVGFPVVDTAWSLDKSTGWPGEDAPAVGEVQECVRQGPLSPDGIGWYWECRVQVRSAERTDEVYLSGSTVTPDDIGEQVRLREHCRSDGSCSYGRPSFFLWPLLVLLLSVFWWLTAIGVAVLGLIELGRVFVGPRKRQRETPEPLSPALVGGGELIVEPSDAAGLTIDFQYPQSVELYSAAYPLIRIDGQTHALTWGTHTVPVEPGRHQLDVVVVAYDAPLHTSSASTSVKVPRQRGVAVTYVAPEI